MGRKGTPMNLQTPRLEIYPSRIEHNAKSIISLCYAHCIQVAGVTKVVSAHPSVVNALVKSGVDMLADSRIENLTTIRKMSISLPLMLLRIPAHDRIPEVIQWSEISLNSSVETIKLLSYEAVKQKKKHQVILMVDLGDLREGVWPDRVEAIVGEIIKLPSIDLIGLGCNLACYGGVIPTTEKMDQLIDLRDHIQRKTGIMLSTISGGNSANLPLLTSGGMPAGINHLRIGEAIHLGRNVLDRSPWQGTRQDTYKIVAQVIELERKPSVPIGVRGQDAFGGTPEFEDRGWRKRAICNLGRQDVSISNLEPVDGNVFILGGSSDHLIVDVENAQSEIRVGSEIAFWPGYAALLAAATSPYVMKVVVEG
jgi:ornithine racemase